MLDDEVNSNDIEETNRRRRSSSESSSDDQAQAQVYVQSVTPSNKRKKTDSANDDEDESKDDRTTIQNDAEVCPICFEEWTNSGQHRLVATECGHLFGKMFVYFHFNILKFRFFLLSLV